MEITVRIFRDLRLYERCCLTIKSSAILLSVSLGKQFLTFRKIVVPSSSGSGSLLHDLADEGTTIVRNVENCLPNDTQ
jgi:hypothetical protein